MRTSVELTARRVAELEKALARAEARIESQVQAEARGYHAGRLFNEERIAELTGRLAVAEKLSERRLEKYLGACQRAEAAYEAYKIAFDQALLNGSKAAISEARIAELTELLAKKDPPGG